ncbi:hypothetical protein [Vannielia sp. SX4]|uniref:hypothetical protein n=1 Tax=Vannielia sp. SX4 TaxID=3463852 RepID=UPI004058703B
MSVTLSHCEMMRLVVSARSQKSEKAEGVNSGHISGCLGFNPPDETVAVLYDSRGPTGFILEDRRMSAHEASNGSERSRHVYLDAGRNEALFRLRAARHCLHVEKVLA